jgi:mannitol/fructose-specific phosphotransferase system IIA component (Ntr-type)
MTSHEPLFSPDRINLNLTAPDRDAALRASAELLSDDARVGDWDEFWTSIGARQVVDLADCAGHVMIAHGRGKSVAALALAAARWSGPHGPCLIFVFAIPAAMSGEYLRKVGALARVCREPEKLAALVSATTTADFAALLEEWML